MGYLDARATYKKDKTAANKAAMNTVKGKVDWNFIQQIKSQMRSDIIIICLQLFAVLSCNNAQQQKPVKANQSSHIQEAHQSSKNIWKQYKRVSGLNVKDTLPYSNCYIIIDDSKLIYKSNGKEMYKDSIFLDKEYKGKRYRFKIRVDDILIVTGSNDEELLLKRDAFEGDYEYFRKEK